MTPVYIFVMDTSNTSTDTPIGIELSTLLKCSKPSAILCHLNIQSVMPKMDEVREILTDTKRPVILGLSETWLDKSVLDGEISIYPWLLSVQIRWR